jgi:sugar-specific transcriptional regulator TrmB
LAGSGIACAPTASLQREGEVSGQPPVGKGAGARAPGADTGRAARRRPSVPVEAPAVWDDAIKELRLLRFSDHEAKVYLSLLATNPATGYEISRASGLPRANVYATLEGLEKQGAVQPVVGKPKRYVPLPPEVMTAKIRSRMEANVGRLLSLLKSYKKPRQADYIWHIEGVAELHERMRELIRSARSYVGIRAKDSVIQAFESDLRDAADRGARIVMVMFGARSMGFGHVFAHTALGMTPIGDVENTVVVTVDHDYALVGSLADGRGAETRSRAFVSVVNTVIRHDAYLSEIFRHVGPAVDRTFGPALLGLRRILLPRSVISELKSKLARTGRLEGKVRTSRKTVRPN